MEIRPDFANSCCGVLQRVRHHQEHRQKPQKAGDDDAKPQDRLAGHLVTMTRLDKDAPGRVEGMST